MDKSVSIPLGPTLSFKARSIKLLKNIRRNKYLFFLLTPAVVYFIVFHYFPMYGVTIAFKEFMVKQGIMGSPWVGFDNFRALFSGVGFPRALRNTLILSAMGLATFPLPIIFALLLNEMRGLRYKKFVQSMSYLPYFMSWMVLGTMFINLLLPSRGIVGWTGLNLITDPSVFRFTLVGTGLWQGIGWSSIIYLAAIAGVNPELYEYARLEGANRLKMAWYITIPQIMPVISILFIMGMGGILSSNREQIIAMANPLVMPVAETLDVYIYNMVFKRGGSMNFSFGAAVDLFKNSIGVVLLLITNFVAGKLSGGENSLF